MSLPHRSAGRSRQVFCTSARLCLVHGFFPSVGATGPAGGVIHSGPRLASSSTLARTKRRVRRCLGGSSSTEPSLCCRRRVTASRTPSPALAVFSEKQRKHSTFCRACVSQRPLLHKRPATHVEIRFVNESRAPRRMAVADPQCVQ